MNTLKIGIVEDDLIIAQSICEMLVASGYTVGTIARRYSEAIALIEDEAPDLLLLDVRILGRLDGIDIAHTVREKFDIPFIFLTANTDFDTISRAKTAGPSAFLSKPVTKAQLFAAIEIAIASFSTGRSLTKQEETTNKSKPDYLFVNDGTGFLKVKHDEILIAESEENYIRLHLSNGKAVLIRNTFTEFAGALDPKKFMRVHRSYIVSIDHISKASPDEVAIAGRFIPVSKTYRAALWQQLGIGS